MSSGTLERRRSNPILDMIAITDSKEFLVIYVKIDMQSIRQHWKSDLQNEIIQIEYFVRVLLIAMTKQAHCLAITCVCSRSLGVRNSYVDQNTRYM